MYFFYNPVLYTDQYRARWDISVSPRFPLFRSSVCLMSAEMLRGKPVLFQEPAPYTSRYISTNLYPIQTITNHQPVLFNKAVLFTNQYRAMYSAFTEVLPFESSVMAVWPGATSHSFWARDRKFRTYPPFTLGKKMKFCFFLTSNLNSLSPFHPKNVE